MTETDLSLWLPIADAAQVIGCSTRTVERLGRDGKLERRLRRQEGTPPVAVYNPDDVARIAAARHPAPPPFVLPAGSGNGHGTDTTRTLPSVQRASLPAAGNDSITQFFALMVQLLSSPPSPPSPTLAASVSENPFLTITEAAAYVRLPTVDIRRACERGDLLARKTGRGGWRIRRKESGGALMHQPKRVHVLGCPNNFRVPVDLCACGGRDFITDHQRQQNARETRRSRPRRPAESADGPGGALNEAQASIVESGRRSSAEKRLPFKATAVGRGRSSSRRAYVHERGRYSTARRRVPSLRANRGEADSDAEGS